MISMYSTVGLFSSKKCWLKTWPVITPRMIQLCYSIDQTFLISPDLISILEESQANHDTPSRKPNTLWIYGDSVGDFFYKSIIRQPLCKKIFKKCNSTYNWVYTIPDRNLTWARLQNDDKDFSLRRVLSEIFEVISQPSMKDDSVLILNLGLHYVHTINFTTYQRLIDKTIRMLTEKFKTNKKSWSFSAKLIWKTTTAIYMEKYGDPRTNAKHSTSIRFLTYQVGRNKIKMRRNSIANKPVS